MAGKPPKLIAQRLAPRPMGKGPRPICGRCWSDLDQHGTCPQCDRWDDADWVYIALALVTSAMALAAWLIKVPG
jgi:hypothetical protein